MDRYVATGAYGIPEAARLARVNIRTARYWISRHRDERPRLLTPDLPPVNDRYALSFLDLIDLLVVGRFREEGVSLRTIRRVYVRLQKTLNTRHAFGHRRLLTDGRAIFLETLDLVERFLKGVPFGYDGQHVKMTDTYCRVRPLQQQMPIYIAGLLNDPETQRRVKALVDESDELLSAIMTSDRRDTDTLSARKRITAATLSMTPARGRATAAYAAGGAGHAARLAETQA